VPASTFKIPNSIIALETGVVKDAIILHGGKPQPFREWKKDMSMREAIALSAVPIYQELARRIGLDRYHEWLLRL
jgi:beta-lactamase class D